MCAPVATMLPALLGAVGVGLQVMGTKKEIDAQNQANKYNARIAQQNSQIAEENAQLAEMRAADATARGEIEEKQHRLRVSQLKGTQRSALAGSGVVVDRGSGLDVLMDTAKFGELDALTIRHNAALESWGESMTARNKRLDSGVYRTQGEMIKRQNRSAGLPMATTLLTGMNRLLPTIM